MLVFLSNITINVVQLELMDHVNHREEYNYVRAIVEDCVPITLSPREIKEASYDDKEL